MIMQLNVYANKNITPMFVFVYDQFRWLNMMTFHMDQNLNQNAHGKIPFPKITPERLERTT